MTEALLRVEGTVQGVGFRPFVYRTAQKLGIRGWVLNDAHGVLIRAAAPVNTLLELQGALKNEAPPAARIERVFSINPAESAKLAGLTDSFRILESGNGSDADAGIPADLAVCRDCLSEMRDPADRRYRYPFINCTNCGPRYSIIEAIPYDRPKTTMREFELCTRCRLEYEDPLDRRFHAQPIACPKCGPKLAYWNSNSKAIASGDVALRIAMGDILAGRIVAVKGIGGFHLMCDAANEKAVQALRERKHREEKPFAIMIPDVESARRLCGLSADEEALLQSPNAPILLAERLSPAHGDVCDSVAPGNALLGIMLPYAPLHHLMFEEWKGSLVATSGNLSDEPICIDNMDACERLHAIADGFLVHDRPIARPVDDSIVRFMMGEPVSLRRARGYAPTPIVQKKAATPVLAVGSHLKNTVSVAVGMRIFPSQHLGDLTTRAACDAFENAIKMLDQLYPSEPERIVCDLHPDYHSTLWAERQNLPIVRVQHHHAHVLSCMAEHHLDVPVLGVSWDGTGYGPDKTIWGGEWLTAPGASPDYRRAAHLRTFLLPGGEAAVRRPALTALGLLWEVFDQDGLKLPDLKSHLQLASNETRVLERMLREKVNTPVTSSAGRLFDGVAALLGLGATVAFEAQAAMKLEFAAMQSADVECYDFRLREDEIPLVVDWAPMLREIINDIHRDIEVPVIARRFHNTLAEMITAVARETPDLPVVLTGGCFQNKLLTESAIRLLRENGLDVYWHRDVPPNDGGISVGQALAGGS